MTDWLHWKQQQPPTCCICLDSESTGRLLRCSGDCCDCVVHSDCYGTNQSQKSTAHGSRWQCDVCLNEASSTAPPVCALCPNEGGAMKPLSIHSTQSPPSSWVHVVCALWFPEVSLLYNQDTRQLHQVDIRSMHPSRFNKVCTLCEDAQDARRGACLSCSVPGCDKAFHVSCALKWNLLELASVREYDASTAAAAVVGAPCPGDLFELHCLEHSVVYEEGGCQVGPGLNEWERWRLMRPDGKRSMKGVQGSNGAGDSNVATMMQTVAGDSKSMTTVLEPLSQFDLYLRAALEQTWSQEDRRVVSFPEKLGWHYQQYSQQRDQELERLKKETMSLLKEQQHCEQVLLERQLVKDQLVEEVQRERRQADEAVGFLWELRRILVRIFDKATREGWDWRLLTGEFEVGELAGTGGGMAALANGNGNDGSFVAASNRNTRSKVSAQPYLQPPSFLSLTDAIDYFLRLNGPTSVPICPSLSSLKKEPTEFLPGMVLNLSEFTGMPTASAPPAPLRMTRLTVCDVCHCRQLPITAPCLPAYRDLLLTCSSCSFHYHLTCVEPMMAHPPSSMEGWVCCFCERAVTSPASRWVHPQDDIVMGGEEGQGEETEELEEEEAAVGNGEGVPGAPVSSLAVTKVKRTTGGNGSNGSRARKPSLNASGGSSTARARARRSSTSASGKTTASASLSISSSTSSLPVDPNLSFSSLKRDLARLTGTQPEMPLKTLRQQRNCTAEEAVIRAYVFDNPTDVDRQALAEVAMWRIMNNLPPGVSAASLKGLLDDGRDVGFGKFAACFRPSAAVAPESIGSTGPGAVSSSSLVAEDAMDATTEGLRPSDTLEDLVSVVSGVDARSLRREAASKPAIVELDEEQDGMTPLEDEDEEYAESDGGDSSARSRRKPSVSSGSQPTGEPFLAIDRQQTKWDGDLYKPFWTRGNGKAKEGWCGLCQPGIWLKTKTSVYWYHMHNFHGISSLAGDFFTPPETIRISEAGLKEALCHQCKKWINVQGDKAVNVEEIYWFKHAQKCHRYATEEDAMDE